ncbi:MAG: biopolymer transporter ExbD [Bdellovibrionota bacterium]
MGSKKKRRPSTDVGPESPELNLMPFIDIFSMLNTFLLVSAAFIGLGILEVQVPFLSNSSEVKEDPQRMFSIRVDLTDTEVKLTSLWTSGVEDKQEKTFKYDPADMTLFHEAIRALRTKVPEQDKLTVYADNTVKYSQLTTVIDNIKTVKDKEAPLNLPPIDGREAPKNFIYEKVVIGSVIL